MIFGDGSDLWSYTVSKLVIRQMCAYVALWLICFDSCTGTASYQRASLLVWTLRSIAKKMSKTLSAKKSLQVKDTFVFYRML